MRFAQLPIRYAGAVIALWFAVVGGLNLAFPQLEQVIADDSTPVVPADAPGGGTRRGPGRDRSGGGATGGVITAAGLIFASSMVAMMSGSVVTLAQMRSIIAMGLVLDTFIVRSLVVPAAATLLGSRMWGVRRHAVLISPLWRRPSRSIVGTKPDGRCEVQAQVGDTIVVEGRNVGNARRDGEVIEVRGEDGAPPYVVRWSDGHEGLTFPGPDAHVIHKE